MTEPSSERLAVALEEAGAPAEMIKRARADYYHDYKSDIPFPETQLLMDARLHGLESIAEGVLEGKWDATKQEADDWARSPEGQSVFRQLLEGGSGEQR